MKNTVHPDWFRNVRTSYRAVSTGAWIDFRIIFNDCLRNRTICTQQCVFYMRGRKLCLSFRNLFISFFSSCIFHKSFTLFFRYFIFFLRKLLLIVNYYWSWIFNVRPNSELQYYIVLIYTRIEKWLFLVFVGNRFGCKWKKKKDINICVRYKTLEVIYKYDSR